MSSKQELHYCFKGKKKPNPNYFAISFPSSPQIPTVFIKGMRAKEKKNLESCGTEC